MNTKIMIPVLVVAIIAAFVIGLLVGRQGRPAASVEAGSGPAGAGGTGAPWIAPVTPGSAPGAGTSVAPAPARPAAPQGGGLTPAEIAKAKNVPAILEDPEGNFQIVAVVEGADANRSLTKNLQLIGAQRQRLFAVSQEFDRLPVGAVQQRELLAGQINQIQQTLARNLQFMAKNYGYSLRYNYRLVPHIAALYGVGTGADGEPAAELVHRFEDAASYERFQKMREEYMLLSVTEAKQAAADAAASPAEDPLAVEEVPAGETPAGTTEGVPAGEGTAEAPSVSAPEPSPELQAMREEMIASFKYDPLKNYQVNLEKTALYARPGTGR